MIKVSNEISSEAGQWLLFPAILVCGVVVRASDCDQQVVSSTPGRALSCYYLDG